MPEPQESIFSETPERVENPGYLRYWDVRSESSAADARSAEIMKKLTQVAILGARGRVEHLSDNPAMQARYWYRMLGPLNPLIDAEPDLIQAANLMYGKRGGGEEETAGLQLDSAYIMADLARHSRTPQTVREALGYGLQAVRDIKAGSQFANREAMYRLQTFILEGDLRHDALRLKHTGELSPKPLGVETYRDYEKAFAQEELREIEEFGKLIQAGITEENFGMLFEWYFVLSRRHEAWADEKIDTVTVRGTTSRENAEWLGEFEGYAETRISSNHDLVVTEQAEDGRLSTERLQLKTVKNGARDYHPKVEVIDFAEALKQRFANIDQATSVLVRNLIKFRNDYRGEG